MSPFKINSIVDELLSFLKSNQHIIHEVHYSEAMNCILFIKRFEKDDYSMTWNEFHFLNCPSSWSSNLCNEGPDTCSCYRIKIKINKIKRIVNFYKQILNE